MEFKIGERGKLPEAFKNTHSMQSARPILREFSLKSGNTFWEKLDT